MKIKLSKKDGENYRKTFLENHRKFILVCISGGIIGLSIVGGNYWRNYRENLSTEEQPIQKPIQKSTQQSTKHPSKTSKSSKKKVEKKEKIPEEKEKEIVEEITDEKDEGKREEIIGEKGIEDEIIGEMDVPEQEEGYQHNVNVSNIGLNFIYDYSYDFYTQIMNGDNQLYYSGDEVIASVLLGELEIESGMTGKVYYYSRVDENGNKYLELPAEVLQNLQSGLNYVNANYDTYRSAIYNICSSMNLYTTDEDLVNQIFDYVCNNFSYSLTHQSMLHCINTHTGQCYHLATVFKDMCSAVGITNNYAATPSHVWNYVTVNGITYTFDPTAQTAWK